MGSFRYLASVSLIGMLCAPVSAIGQQAAPPAEGDTPTAARVDEIIVTAQRRDQTLEKTPVSVVVVSSGELAEAQIVSEQDLRSVTPGLSVRATGNSNQLNYVVRGESQDAFADNRPGVMPYVNEVQVGGAGGSTGFYDLQSVQVLKGPQGTLFGRSATGGAVLFTTAKPTDELSGYASASIGNYNSRKFEGAISGPVIGDALKLRVAGLFQERDGFQFNLYDGGREGDLKREGIRTSATLDLGSVRNEFMFDYLRSSGSSTVAIISGVIPPNAAAPPFIPGSLLYGGTTDPTAAATGAAILSAATGTDIATATAFYNAYFSDPRRNPDGLLAEFAAQQARGPYVVNVDGINAFRARNIVVTNATSVDVGESVVLKNIFGYSRAKQTNWVDYDGTPYNFASQGVRGDTRPSGGVYDVRAVSNELQLSGKALDDRLDFVVGLYYSDEKFKHFQNAYYFDLFYGGAAVVLAYDTKTRTQAAYGEGTYKLNDAGLSVTLGARYTNERVNSITNPESTNRIALGEPAPAGFSYNLQDTFKNVSWRIGLQQQASDELMLYLSAARAYRTGGFNGVPPPQIGFAETGGVAYREQQVTAAEVGAKFAGTLGDMPARANVAAFYTWGKNSQRVAYTVVAGSPGSLTANVPRSRIYGVEYDGYVKPAEWLTLGATGAYVHAKFLDDPVFLNGTPQAFDQVPDTPRFSGTIFADVRIPVSGDIDLLGHADYYMQSKSNTSPRSANNIGTVVPSYELLNLRFGFEDVNAGWSLVANVKNVLKKVYYVGGIPNGAIYAVNTLLPGDPRTFTVEARFSF